MSCIPDATGTPVIPSSALIWTLRFVPEVLAMSEDPSPLKSPTMVVLPAPPAARTAAANVPSPLPASIMNPLAVRSIRSVFPSRLKSA